MNLVYTSFLLIFSIFITFIGEWWGADENCVVIANLTDKSFLGMERCYPGIREENCTYIQSSTSQFWEKYVLNISNQLSPNFGDIGGFKYDLPLALLLSWIVVFLCLMKGVKSSGKVVYFTATFPYVILIALLVRGCTLDGAADGLYYLFVPDWEKLLTLKPWQKAAEQMFFSLGISWGGLMMFGSYNKFNNKVRIKTCSHGRKKKHFPFRSTLTQPSFHLWTLSLLSSLPASSFPFWASCQSNWVSLLKTWPSQDKVGSSADNCDANAKLF